MYGYNPVGLTGLEATFVTLLQEHVDAMFDMFQNHVAPSWSLTVRSAGLFSFFLLFFLICLLIEALLPGFIAIYFYPSLADVCRPQCSVVV
jgi:hypothetical protein